jgi:hypothetical protein
MRRPQLASWSRRTLAAAALAAACVVVARAEPGRYLELDEFLAGSFGAVPEQAGTLTLPPELRRRLEAILEHRFARLRVQYWSDGEATAWVLDEIGKTEPITVGIAVRAGKVERVRVLEFRESRGWEIRYPFFTDQFAGAGLAGNDRIDRTVDGITGATLSVIAVDKLVRVALLLDQHVRSENEAASS